MSDDDSLYGNFDPGRAIGRIPTKEVLISNDETFSMNGGVPPRQSIGFNTQQVTVPDLKELGLDDLATESLLKSHPQRRREKVEHQTWQALFDVAESSEQKQLDAAGTGRFVDTLMDASQRLHQQGGDPEDAYLFMNQKTKGYVHDWIQNEVRFNSPTGEDGDYKAATIQVNGISFQCLVSPHPEPDQLVMVSDEMYAAPESVPLVVIDNLPIGVEIRIEVDGEDNNIVID